MDKGIEPIKAGGQLGNTKQKNIDTVGIVPVAKQLKNAQSSDGRVFVSPEPHELVQLICERTGDKTNFPNLFLRFALMSTQLGFDNYLNASGFEFVCTSFIIIVEFSDGNILRQSHDEASYEKAQSKHKNDYEFSIKPEISFDANGLPKISFGEFNWKRTSQVKPETIERDLVQVHGFPHPKGAAWQVDLLQPSKIKEDLGLKNLRETLKYYWQTANNHLLSLNVGFNNFNDRSYKIGVYINPDNVKAINCYDNLLLRAILRKSVFDLREEVNYSPFFEFQVPA